MNLGDIIQELTDEELNNLDKNLHNIDKHILKELLEWYEERFGTLDTTIAQDIRYKKIIKELNKMIKEKRFVESI